MERDTPLETHGLSPAAYATSMMSMDVHMTTDFRVLLFVHMVDDSVVLALQQNSEVVESIRNSFLGTSSDEGKKGGTSRTFSDVFTRRK
jgi:hypothetical protein